jgi:plasmid stabilization system protein ParE
MKYQVYITDGANEEISSTYHYIAQRAPLAAKRWKKGIRAAIRSLATHPERFGLAHESASFPYQVRQMLYGRKRNHRVLYTIRDELVVILAVRHAARDDATPGDFE